MREISLSVAVIFTMLSATKAQNSAEKIIAGNEGLYIGGFYTFNYVCQSEEGSLTF